MAGEEPRGACCTRCLRRDYARPCHFLVLRRVVVCFNAFWHAKQHENAGRNSTEEQFAGGNSGASGVIRHVFVDTDTHALLDFLV